MASGVRGAVPKLRSRAQGAAVPLDETDKRLLNALQSRFPLDPRPFEAVAREAGHGRGRGDGSHRASCCASASSGRSRRSSTRRRSATARCSWPRRWTRSSLHRAARIINEHPGVSHNYLRNHDFNLWFTIATAPDSKLGLDGTLEVLRDLSGAESIRKLPTLTMFKINMNLEMEGGTDKLAAPVEAVEPQPRDPVPIDDFDVAVIRALQGPMEVRPDPYAPAAERLGVTEQRLLEHLEGMIGRKVLRRVAAILFHRRAGFSANGMGVWKVPEEQIAEIGPRMAAVRGVSHCYRRPTYPDWPYSVFTMAHGRSKEECDAVLDGVAAVCGLTGEDRSTLYSSTEFKKIRLHYFTPDYADWEATE